MQMSDNTQPGILQGVFLDFYKNSLEQIFGGLLNVQKYTTDIIENNNNVMASLILETDSLKKKVELLTEENTVLRSRLDSVVKKNTDLIKDRVVLLKNNVKEEKLTDKNIEEGEIVETDNRKRKSVSHSETNKKQRTETSIYCRKCDEYGHVTFDVHCDSCGKFGHVRRYCYCMFCKGTRGHVYKYCHNR